MFVVVVVVVFLKLYYAKEKEDSFKWNIFSALTREKMQIKKFDCCALPDIEKLLVIYPYILF